MSPVFLHALDGRSLVRFFFMTAIDAAAAEALWNLLRPAAVSVAGGAEIDEFLQNDPTIVWPNSEALGALPAEFRKAARGKQPYYINHVKGSARCLQALMRCCVRDQPPFAPREGVASMMVTSIVYVTIALCNPLLDGAGGAADLGWGVFGDAASFVPIPSAQAGLATIFQVSVSSSLLDDRPLSAIGVWPILEVRGGRCRSSLPSEVRATVPNRKDPGVHSVAGLWASPVHSPPGRYV